MIVWELFFSLPGAGFNRESSGLRRKYLKLREKRMN